MCTPVSSFGCPSHVSYHRALSRVACARQEVLVSYLLIRGNVHTSVPVSQSFHFPFPLFDVHVFSISVSSSALKIDASVPFV